MNLYRSGKCRPAYFPDPTDGKGYWFLYGNWIWSCQLKTVKLLNNPENGNATFSQKKLLFIPEFTKYLFPLCRVVLKSKDLNGPDEFSLIVLDGHFYFPVLETPEADSNWIGRSQVNRCFSRLRSTWWSSFRFFSVSHDRYNDRFQRFYWFCFCTGPSFIGYFLIDKNVL